MSDTAPEQLSIEHVRHMAKLARLRLREDQVERYRTQLSSVLKHIDKLNELDVDGLEPMAHPTELSNRFAEDQPASGMDVAELLKIAPSVEGPFLAVPKILGEEEIA